MLEKFNGIIYLIIFIVHFLAYAFYAYRTIFTTKAFLDQYGMDVTGSIMTRFFGSLFVGAVVMVLYILFVRPNGVEGTWGFFNLVFLFSFFITNIQIPSFVSSKLSILHSFRRFCFMCILLDSK